MRILSIDIGGTGLKAAVLNRDGDLVSDHLRVLDAATLSRPDVLVKTLKELVAPFKSTTCIAMGFPGVVMGGKVIPPPISAPKCMQATNSGAEAVERAGR